MDNKETSGRVLWYDPNLANNTMVNPEDLSIKVEFTSYKKGRTIIYSGQEAKNSGGKDLTVGFIEGSRVNSTSPQPSLTTRYNDAIALEIMNTTTDKVDDYESLGIESIDIEFDTANTPLIKIKFIDVRGNAILSQGTMSKYRMFFELPYPIFSLKVKGFYGKTVNYCLHMLRWNASFNSDTGNFEIQADFMGYTYAMLTDILMGLVRAAVRTKAGQEKLKLKQAEYGENSNLVITIDEMLKSFVDLNNSLRKTSADDDTASQIQTYPEIYSAITELEGEINKLSNAIYDGNPANNFFRSPNGDVLCVPSNSDTKAKYEKAFKEYKDKLTNLLSNVNSKIDIGGLKLSENELNDIKITLDITKKEINDSNNVNLIIQKTNGNNQYASSGSGLDKLNDLLKTIGTLGTSSASDSSKIDIYNLKSLYGEINFKRGKIEENQKTTTTEFNNTLSETAIGIIGFEPTIRNIFRVLTINSEIFLEVLRDVSVAGQSNQNRTAEFKKLVDTQANLNVHENDVNNGVIYAWPEYREKKDKEGYVETWLGSVKTINPNNINEVVFVEEMLKELVNVALFDKELDKEIENAGLDIDSDPTTIKDAWYPLCTADTPVNDLLTENPYIKVCEPGNPDAVKRLILLRAFMFMGVSAYDNKIPFVVGNKDENTLELMGAFEAGNIVEASRKKGQAGQTLISELIDSKTTDDLFFNITKIGLEGSENIESNNKKKPIMSRVDKEGKILSTALKNLNDFYYRYKYISNGKNETYIPISGSFDGSDFYSNGKLKSNKQLKDLSNSVLFISNPINSNYSEFRNFDNGSYLFKIYEKDQYLSKTMKPSFGNEDSISSYNRVFEKTNKVINVDSLYGAIIEPSTKDDPQSTLKVIEPLSGNYSALEISNLNYDYSGKMQEINFFMGEPSWKRDAAIDTSLIGFYTQYSPEDYGNRKAKNLPYYGTYLSEVTTNIDKFKVFYNKNSEIVFSNYLIEFSENEKRNAWSDSNYLKNKTLISKYFNQGAKLYLPFIEFGIGTDSNKGDKNLSLFGSYFYYAQKSDEARALLFLHTIPWQGVKNFGSDLTEMLMFDKYIDWGGTEGNKHFTRVHSHKAMFSVNSAFIHAPKAWVLFIGAMLWRIREAYKNKPTLISFLDYTDPIEYVDYNNYNKYTLIPKGIDKHPDIGQFLYLSYGTKQPGEENPWGLFFGANPGSSGSILYDALKYTDENNTYTPIDKTLINLPKQVRDEFINYFETWVQDENGWQFIKNNLELFKGRKESDYNKWVNNCNTIDIKQKYENNRYSSINRTELEKLFTKEVTDNYEFIAAYQEIVSENNNLNTVNTINEGNLFTVLKPNTSVMDYMVSLLTTPVILQNNNPSIWHNDNNTKLNFIRKAISNKKKESEGVKEYKQYLKDISSSSSIKVRATEFNVYLKSLCNELITLNDSYSKEVVKSEEEEAKQEIFGTTDDNTIKLIIYRTLSSINDKWLNGELKGSVFSQCGANAQNSKDLQYAKKFRGESADTSTLIDTFRFVDRAFADIGDEFYININSVTDLIRSNYNQSFFDVVNKILSDNNFNFFTLPTFINFNNIDELSSVFTPYSYNDPITFSGTGPSFVCCYVGQTSTNLDLGVGSVYPDDGLSIHKDASGKFIISEGAEDFSEPIESNSLDSLVPVFSVNYGQQNQNYFKNVKLDQREFTETMESLQTIEDISQGGDKSKATYRGNNLFNVYQTRSYSAEIEMLGAPMIQPMMYFQLNNIPMFRGAYLIYKVNHSIKPHSMITSFKGNRTKKTKTPLVDKATMLMNLVGTTPGGSGGGASISRRKSGSFPPIVRTIIENNGTNGNIESGNIKLKLVNNISGVQIDVPQERRKMLSEATVSLTKMLTDFVSFAKNKNYPNINGNYINITSLYRSEAYQQQLYNDSEKDGSVAPPGTSNHSWGIAVDLRFVPQKDGKFFKLNNWSPVKVAAKSEGFNLEYNKSLEWFLDKSYEYGFTIPYTLRDGSKVDEFWHFEYHGTSAKCMVEKNPNVYGYKMDTSGKINSIVKNPKTPDGKEAVYTNCDYKFVKIGDGSETEARKQMKVENLPPGFEPTTVKAIIKNGTYGGRTISDWENNHISIAANYIAKKEANSAFTARPKFDENAVRGGYGTDMILKQGATQLTKVDENTVFTKETADNTLIYQIVNEFIPTLKNDLGISNWNKLNKYQKATLISLGYNAGANFIIKRVYGREIKDGISNNDFEAAAQGILNGPITGIKSGYLPSLKKRREEEARLFLLNKNEKIKYT
jgi:GH24 family phage-related lysozyme (muramidase)/LAS superfamily LD-carboxypeptidase LdcB